jgi:hypothetical protein
MVMPRIQVSIIFYTAACKGIFAELDTTEE